MKTYNSPAQARNLREIEEAAATPIIKTVVEKNENEQSVPTTFKEEEEETRTEAKAEAPAQKARSKKKTASV